MPPLDWHLYRGSMRASNGQAHEPETHPASMALAPWAPVGRCGWRLVRRILHIDECAGLEPAAFERSGDLGQEPRIERRIQEYDVEGRGLAAEPSERIRLHHLAALRLEDGEMALQGFGHAPLPVHEHRRRGTARQGFEAESTAACEEVKTASPFYMILQPVEQGLPHPIRRRAYPRQRRELELPPTPDARDDAELVAVSPAGI